MPSILETFRPQWGDMEHGRHSPRKRKDDHRRPRFPARKSTIIGFVICFLFLVIVMRRFYQIQLEIPNDRPHALQSKGTNKYAIVTFETRDVTYWRQSLGNKYGYSRRHGYDFIPYFQSLKNDDKGGVWAKIVVVNETLNSGLYEWVLWKDFDTLFTNTSIRIEDFMEDARTNHLNSLDTGQQWKDVDMIVSRDCQTFNAGVMFFRNSAWTREYLDVVWSRRMETGVSEQDLLRDTLEKMGEFGQGNKHFLSVSQFKLNSYPEEIGCHEDFDRRWQSGDWIIHFAGAWASLDMKDSKDPFGDMLRRYYPKIVDF